MTPITLRPSFKAFFAFPFAVSFASFVLIALIALVIGFAAGQIILALCGMSFFVVGYGYSWINLYISYKKEKYELLADRLIRHGGGLFNNYSVELKWRNVAHVDMVLPFFAHSLFKTGDIIIKSVATGEVATELRSLDLPTDTRDKVITLLNKSGIEFETKDLQHQDRPTPFAVLIDLVVTTFQMIVGLGALMIYAPDIPASILRSGSTGLIVVLVIFVLVILPIYFGVMALRYLDVKRQVYQVYADVIVYRKGFLTKHFAFIPVANLADSTTGQNFLQRLFGIYDVILSSTGSGDNVAFRNIVNGPAMEQSVDKVIATQKRSASLASVKQEVMGEKAAPSGSHQSEIETNYEELETLIWRMDWIRAIAWEVFSLIPICLVVCAAIVFPPLVVLLFAALGSVFSIVGKLITVAVTKYEIRANSVVESYKFLTTRVLEFTNDKITNVVITRSPIDWLFKTATVQISSIGAVQPIVLRNIKMSNAEQLVLLRAVRMNYIESNPLLLAPQFNLIGYISSNFWAWVWLPLPLAGLSVLLVLADFAIGIVLLVLLAVFIILISASYSYLYYQYDRAAIGKNLVTHRFGLLVRRWQYAKTRYVKDIVAIEYPGLTQGEVKLDLAGQAAPETDNAQQQNWTTWAFSGLNKVSVGYLPNALATSETIAAGVYSAYDAQPQSTYRSDWQNEVLNYCLLAIFTIVGLLGAPLMLFAATKRRYVITKTGLIAKWGIFFRSTQYVSFDSIDHTSKGQGLLNQIFGNGSILINTAGSTAVDMRWQNLHNYQQAYELIAKASN